MATADTIITPRETRLFSAPTLGAYQRAIAARVADARLALEGGEPAILVPTRAAADQLRRTLRELSAGSPARAARPAILPRGDWYDWLHERAAIRVRLLTQLEREVLGRLAARDASAAGAPPPFRLRAGIVTAFLAFYDELRRRQRTVDAFERLLVDDLEPSADLDRGARRLLDQTRFLAAAFRAYERRLEEAGGLDEHGLRDRLCDAGTREPLPEVIVTVPDHVAHPAGLYPADYDLLARLPGLARVTIIATDAVLDSGLRERLDHLLPEIDEHRVAPQSAAAPRLVIPAGDADDRAYFLWRDREEELRGIARTVGKAREGERQVSAAVVVARPLPYGYLAPPVFAEAGLRPRAGDGLPLAAEPYAAAVGLVLQYVAGDRSASTMSLFRNPHFDFGREDEDAARAELAHLDRPRPLASHLAALREFLHRHVAPPADPPDSITARTARTRALIHEALAALETAHRAWSADEAEVAFAEAAPLVRRWIESRTYPPERGAVRNGDVHLIDPHAAAYGHFDHIFLAGLIEADWPPRAERNIFYPGGMLAALGWPPESERLRATRALFRDLLDLARDRVQISAFLLEDDAAVAASPMLEDLDVDAFDRIAAPDAAEAAPPEAFPVGAGVAASPDASREAADASAGRWRAFRLARAEAGAARDRLRGGIGPQAPRAYAVSALERYLDCPFKYFARHTLRLEEEDEEEQTMTALERGRFLHRVFEEFFRAWQGDGGGAITLDTFDAALERFAAVAEGELARLPPAEQAVAGAWLFGSPASAGLAERLFSREAERRTADIVERLPEYRIAGSFELGAATARRTVALRGSADRIDLHADGTLTVVDYKIGRAPDRSRALQLPLYARCAEQQLRGYRDRDWRASGGMYVAFGESRLTVPMEGRGEAAAAMDEGEARALAAVAGIEAGECPPRPAELFRCTMCPYQTVCRKDYVEDL